jgi:hypothetical protein
VKEKEAKKALRRMLKSYTPGSILHLLADLYREDAEVASRAEDAPAYERMKTLECALFVVGLGADAAFPQ